MSGIQERIKAAAKVFAESRNDSSLLSRESAAIARDPGVCTTARVNGVLFTASVRLFTLPLAAGEAAAAFLNPIKR